MGTGNTSPEGNAHDSNSNPSRPAATRIEVDTSQALAGYANFCRVTGTPEEVLLDFGLNDHPFDQSPQPIHISNRIVLNYFTAKRMLAALQMTVRRHEQSFGALEVDLRKRVVASPQHTSSPDEAAN